MSKRRRLQSLARRLFRSLISPLQATGESNAPVGKTEKAHRMRPIRFEPLETRQLMANDFYSSVTQPTLGSSSSSVMSTRGLVGEGEDVNDLVGFAKALKDAGVVFYGAIWCPFCNDQKNLFEDGYKYLDFKEVTNPDKSLNALGTQKNITKFPTWELGNTRVENVQTLQQLSTIFNVPIPKSSTPSFATIPTQTVLIGSPLHVPVDAYDPNGNPLTIEVTSSNPGLVSADVLSGNKSAKVSVEGFGDMTFELFDTEVQRAAGRFISLANAGFYNKTANNTVTFHRVVNTAQSPNFVIQGGDPTGTGSGGSNLGKFDDQYDVDLQHNQAGILSFAKSSDDTNDSQFFVTLDPQRDLDFNHSVFGMQIEGVDRRTGIGNTPVASQKPITPVVISSVSIFDDQENGLIRLKSVSGQTGTATISVTVRDTEGNSTQQNFTVNVTADNKNSAPFLNPVVVPTAAQGQPVNIQLSSQDVEGDPVYYDAILPSGANYTVNANHTTGLITLTPNSGFTGTMTATLGVRALNGADTVDSFDTQVISVATAVAAPTSVDLAAASDTGSSNSDNITNSGSMQFVVSGTVSGATVNLRVNGNTVGTAVATGTTTTITTNNIAALGAGTYSVVATQVVSSQTSSESPALSIVYDNVQPVALTSGVIPTTGNVGSSVSVNLSHAEEGTGLVYGLTTAPTGMTIDPATGALSWTPTAAQLGAQTFGVTITDAAGNTRSQPNTITVSDVALGAIELDLTDLNGNVITSASVGQSFKVQVYVNDLREAAQGVFSAFLDLIYNSTLIELDGTNPITRGTVYTNTATGDTTTAGLVNELGGVSNTTAPLGGGRKLLAEVRLKTKAVGTATFTAENADGTGAEFLVYGSNIPVAVSRINFDTASLSVGLDFTVGNDTYNFNEDSSNNSMPVLQNDIVQSGSTSVLTVQSVSTGSAGGTITLASDNKSLIYKPAANFNGSETFTYIARNQAGASATGSVTVQVQPVNDPPVAVADTTEVIQDSSENFIAVLTNDTSGPDTGESLRVSAVGTTSQGGTVRIASSGLNVFYTPKAGFTGTDTFTYTLSDGTLTTTASVTVTVKPSVPPPTAVSDSFTVVEDAASADFAVLSNDTPSQTGETLSILSATAANGGTVSVTTDGQKINYKPAANFSGTEIVRYTLKGSLGGQTTGTATFTVTAVNDAPTGVNDALNALSTNATTSLDVLKNDTNVDLGETLTISAVTQPTTGSGSIAISTDKKSLIYTPPSSTFQGPVTFSYTLSDGTLTATANVTLTVESFTLRNIGGNVVTSKFLDETVFVNEILIEGADFRNNPVSQTLVVTNGQATPASLPPGSYTLKAAEVPFLTGGTTQVQVQSSMTDGNSVNNQISLGGLSAAYFDIRDFVIGNIGKGLTIAAKTGSTQSWASGLGNWKNFKNLQVTLNNDATSMTLQGTRSNNQVVSSTIPVSNNSKAHLIASSGDSHLIRLRLDPNDITFTPVTTTPATNSTLGAGGEGEGASVSVPTPASVAPQTASRLNAGLSSQGEGEGEGSVVANDIAMSQISSNIQHVSPAGDFIAEQDHQSPQDISDATDAAFEKVEDLLLT